MTKSRNTLQHYGIPGMKWGKRKISEAIGKIRKMREDAEEKNWEMNATNVRTFVRAYNKTADHMNANVIPAINNNPKYKDKDFSDPKNAKLYDRYLSDYKAAFKKALSDNVSEAAGLSPHQGRYVNAEFDEATSKMVFRFEEMKQEDAPDFSFYASVDKYRHIVAFDLKSVDDIVEHVGVLGMRWGRRKGSDDISSTPRKKKVDEMSDQELSEKVKRLNLEKQFSDLSSSKKSKGRKFVESVLGEAAKQTAAKYVSKAMTGVVDIVIAKLSGKS